MLQPHDTPHHSRHSHEVGWRHYERKPRDRWISGAPATLLGPRPRGHEHEDLQRPGRHAPDSTGQSQASECQAHPSKHRRRWNARGQEDQLLKRRSAPSNPKSKKTVDFNGSSTSFHAHHFVLSLLFLLFSFLQETVPRQQAQARHGGQDASRSRRAQTRTGEARFEPLAGNHHRSAFHHVLAGFFHLQVSALGTGPAARITATVDAVGMRRSAKAPASYLPRQEAQESK